MGDEGNGSVKPAYCVTGASGYIGSWLVRSLLQRGCLVHATFREPEKASHFVESWDGGDRLSVFKADLHEDGSFDEAVRGCHGVFHVAASMEMEAPPAAASQNLDRYITDEVVNPAIKGTLNVLKSCLKTTTIKRIVFTSSISTLSAKDSRGAQRSIVDESCRRPVQEVLQTKANGWVYSLSKILSEEAAFQFAKENQIDLVSVIAATVGGSFLTPSVPASIQVLLSPLTGDPNLLPILEAVNSRMGSVGLVHIEDICGAHIFVMEHPRARGQYLCCTQTCRMSRLIELLGNEYSCGVTDSVEKKQHESVVATEISSKKLKDLGFSFRHSLQEIIHQSVQNCVDYGFLQSI